MDRVIIELESGHGVTFHAMPYRPSSLIRAEPIYSSLKLAGRIRHGTCDKIHEARYRVFHTFLMTGSFQEDAPLDGITGGTVLHGEVLFCNRFKSIYHARVGALNRVIDETPDCSDVFMICHRAGKLADGKAELESS